MEDELKKENEMLRKQIQEMQLQAREELRRQEQTCSPRSDVSCDDTCRSSCGVGTSKPGGFSFKKKMEKILSRLGSTRSMEESQRDIDRSGSDARKLNEDFLQEQLKMPDNADVGDRLLRVFEELDPGWMSQREREKKPSIPMLNKEVLKRVLGKDDRACWASHWDDDRGTYRLWVNQAAKMLFGSSGGVFAKRTTKKRIQMTDAMNAQMQAVFWRARADFDEGVHTPRATFMLFYPGGKKQPVLLRTFVSTFRFHEPAWANKEEGIPTEGLALFIECVPQRLHSIRHLNILMRQHVMFKNAASPMTMFLIEESSKVRAMEQNPASMAFMGYLADDEMKNVDSKDAPDGPCDDDCEVILKDDLEHLFGSENLHLVSELLEDVRRGKRWVQRVKVASESRLPSCFSKNTGLYSRISTSMEEIWHEVAAIPTKDPVTGLKTVVINQTDITDVVAAEAEARKAALVTKQLLQALLPQHIIRRLIELEGAEGAIMKRSPTMMDRVEYLAEEHPSVTILFADIVGFTSFSQSVQPKQVMSLLNTLYDGFDRMIDEFKIYKVETIGDSYMVVGGLLECKDGDCVPSKGDTSHALRVVKFGMAMLEYASTLRKPDGSPLRLRIGVHSGPCVSGIVGTKVPRYCLFGDTVNVASRMESTGIPDCIQASFATRDLAKGMPWEALGERDVKGKGKMLTYMLKPTFD